MKKKKKLKYQIGNIKQIDMIFASLNYVPMYNMI